MPDLTEDIFFLTAVELNAKLKAKELSAKDLTRAYLERLGRLGPPSHAVALLLRERALDQAGEVDADLKRGRYRGPLQGVPFGAKDLLSVAGLATTWGARPLARQVFENTATVLDKLQHTGALLVAKLAMVELAGAGGYRSTSASLFGPGINPWDRSRWSGGSSSGSAAAVAAGLVPFALGSETWGSILTPCAYCGVTGLRPTYGLVSRAGAMALSWTMDKIGPIAHSAEDCGIILDTIAGGDTDDPGSAGKSFYYAPKFFRKFPDIHVAYAPVDFEEWADPAARPAFKQALDVIRSIGVPIREASLPDFPYADVARLIIDAEGSAAFETLIESGQVDQLADPVQIAGLKAGLTVPASDYLRAMRIRRLIQQAMRTLFVEHDVLISASRFAPATRLEEPVSRPPEGPAPAQRGFSDLSAAGNLAGLPALSLPCGFANGLPVSIQLVGRPFSESILLALGREFQNQTDWHKRRPPRDDLRVRSEPRP
jgi:aspartyl-tRNA(Asn)/glutamyl-tRNA(Gln) amidotransferase subunit A